MSSEIWPTVGLFCIVRKADETSETDRLWWELIPVGLQFVSLSRDDYFRMKLQWKTISPEQEKRFATLRERKGLIGRILSSDISQTFKSSAFGYFRSIIW